MAINKVVYGDTPLIDLTEDTVSPENLMAGETAHDRSGEEIEGTLITNEVKEVPYEEWSEMTPEEQADGSVYFIPNYPVLGGVYFFQTEAAMRAAEAMLPDNAICITLEDTPYVITASAVGYDNTASDLDATDVNGAIDEVVEALDGKQDALTNPLTQSDVVNNLTSTATNVPLSAAMGKALNDGLSELKSPVVLYNYIDNQSGVTDPSIHVRATKSGMALIIGHWLKSAGGLTTEIRLNGVQQKVSWCNQNNAAIEIEIVDFFAVSNGDIITLSGTGTIYGTERYNNLKVVIF